MARVIVIVTLMVLITATMFAITRKSAVAPGVAANGPTTTVKLADLPQPAAPREELKDDEDGQSLTAAEPRPVTNEIVTASTSAPKSAQDVTNGPVAGAAPSVGSAGIDHKGNASFTGTATPGDTVTLVWDGKTMGTSQVDESGNWEVLFKAPTAKSEHELYASAQSKDGTVVIGPQRTTIRPPATEGGLPRITIKSADQTATTLQEGHVAAPEPKTGLVVEKITNSETGLTILIGKADAGATVKAAINGKPAGDARVAADGSFTLAATNPSGKAAKRIRLELVDADGTKIDEADLPHQVPAAAKPDTTSKEVAALSTAPETTAAADRPKAKIIRVRRGDSLWRISKRHLGKGRKWAAFYKANKKKIDNPDLIYPGQTLIIPG